MRFTKTLFTTVLFGASVFLFNPPLGRIRWNSNSNKVLKLQKRGDYQTAFKLWLPLAEQGNASIQFNLGLMYKRTRHQTR